MFCLDYACAFFVHYALASPWSEATQAHPAFTFGSGAVAGAAAAIALYPFDIVRQTTVAPGSSHFAFSTIPFMSAYLGIYFMQPYSERQAKPFKTKVGWALGATSVAAAVELPFDSAKISISGTLRSAALATALRVPLGSALLLAYDQILSSANKRIAR
mmetsp:Transcript_1590/g.3373  ORF Transcript_1590/g.3373 Transcript_1590/m.3373 type:complete len:159 (-) Transcript_1590:171-647(-)